jgi:tetratricopeptide (TPR) repeat protein
MRWQWWRGRGWLLLLLALGGCDPAAKAPVDEQKNPYYLSGKERVAARDYQRALEAFEKALEVNPRSALAHFDLGVLYEEHENDYAAALYHYNQAIKLRPQGGYPAELAKIRVPGCRQQLVAADRLAETSPATLRELDRLRDENQLLKKQVEGLQTQAAQLAAQLAARPSAPATSPSPAQPLPPPPAPSTVVAARGTSPGAAAPMVRSHAIKAGDTFASIARQYNVRLDALLAANPGVNPKKLKVGQSVNVPPG